MRAYLKDLEALRPAAILDIITSGEAMADAVRADVKMPMQRLCERCSYISSQPLCKACLLLEGLNRGLPRLGISRRGFKEASGQRDVARETSAGTRTAW